MRFTILKGGVGKTTLAINIAYELSKRDNKVLIVDLDDQANASLTIGVNKAEEINNASIEELREIYKFLDERLVENRSYSDLSEVQTIFGVKRVLRWLSVYKQKY